MFGHNERGERAVIYGLGTIFVMITLGLLFAIGIDDGGDSPDDPTSL